MSAVQKQRSRKRQATRPAPGKQPVAKRQKVSTGRKRKRNAKRGRVASTRGYSGAIFKDDNSTVLQHAVPELDDVIEKDEYVGDIIGSGGAANVSVTKYSINPGNSTLFPLGSAEAAKWTNWKCESMEVYLLHEVSEFATDGSTGKVILAVDYNAANDTPTTKQQVEDMHSASAMGCEDVGLRLIPALLNRADPKYIRVGAKPAGTDIRLYDGGNLFVVAAGQAGTTKISELRVRYRFRLQLPTLLNPTGGLSDDSSVAQFLSAAAGEADANGTTVAYQMLVAQVQANGMNAVNTAGSVVPPAGDYRVSFQCECQFGSTANTGFSVNILKNGASPFPGAAIGAGRSAVYVTATNSLITLATEAILNCNGTDALTFTATPTYSGGGNPTMFGSVILQLV